MKQIICLCLVLFSLVCQAARQESDMSMMIISLHHELTHKWNEIQMNRKATDQQLLKIDTLIHQRNESSKQCAITVYSTDENSFQDVAFANQNAISQYQGFSTVTAPYISMLKSYKQAKLRQDSLLIVLSSINSKTLTTKAQKLLPETFSTLSRIQKYDTQVLNHLEKLSPEYTETYKRLKQTAANCQQKYEIIRSNVLYNFNGNILDIISDWDGYMRRMSESKDLRWSVDEEFNTLAKKEGAFRALVDSNLKDVSYWGSIRVVSIFFILILFVVLSVLLGLLVCLIRWITKRVCMLKTWSSTRFNSFTTRLLHSVTYLSGLKTFSLVTVWANVILWYASLLLADDTTNDDIDPLSIQILFFSALLAIISTFFLLRYTRKQFWGAIAVCTPTMLALVYSLTSVIMVMPDDEIVVEMTFLSIFLFILQLLIHWRFHKHLDDLMMKISRLSLLFLGASMVIALFGLQFLSTMAIVFWCCFMVCMMILTALKRWFETIIQKYHYDEKTIKGTWWIPVLNSVLYPMAWIYAVLLSCQIACSIYALDDFINHLMNTYFRTPLGNISININLLIFICWSILIAAYISKIAYKFLDYYHKSHGDVTWKDTSFFNLNTIRVIVWGGAILNIMIRMGFSMQWVGYCMAGLSTGLAFASREILEDLIYGLTMRNGQLNIGDWILCEGIRGQIKSIGLLSTRLYSVEGSVVTFSNSRLFRMNFENITLNHGYELLHTAFCVNFGEDIESIRKMLVDGYQEFDCYDKKRPVTVYIKKINNNQVDLDFRTWVLASDRIRLAAFNLEYVYKTLNENGIKYPYPYIEVSNS